MVIYIFQAFLDYHQNIFFNILKRKYFEVTKETLEQSIVLMIIHEALKHINNHITFDLFQIRYHVLVVIC